ncbi:MAG: type 11 methyltransferase [Parcubacteria group bacterium]|nr:type 11 methyltransferase [Parcubacteria group bacterium]
MNFSDPKTNMLQMGLREGMKIGDLGTGSGHYAIAAAGAVGADGRVYAIDIQEDVLKHMLDSAHRVGLRNVETIWGNIEKPGGTKLKDHTLDAAVLSNTLFQIENKEALVTEIKRILKPGGRLLVIDWAGAYGGLGPIASHVVSEHAAEELFIKGGFHKLKDFRGGAHHYAIVFVSPAV